MRTALNVHTFRKKIKNYKLQAEQAFGVMGRPRNQPEVTADNGSKTLSCSTPNLHEFTCSTDNMTKSGYPLDLTQGRWLLWLTFSFLGPSFDPGEKIPKIESAEIRNVGTTMTVM